MSFLTGDEITTEFVQKHLYIFETLMSPPQTAE